MFLITDWKPAGQINIKEAEAIPTAVAHFQYRRVHARMDR